LKKPQQCKGCSLYGDGNGFVPDEIVPGSSVLVVGQNPGREEEIAGKPFVGDTGKLMMRDLFPIAGVERGETVSLGNTLRCRWRKSNDLPPESMLKPALVHCRVHDVIPESTRIIVASGALAWRVLSNGLGSVSSWRGFLAEGKS
jgi:uracil-DNA glycosylase family 4